MAADCCGALGSRFEDAVDEALTENTVRAVIRASVADGLTQGTFVNGLVFALKDHDATSSTWCHASPCSGALCRRVQLKLTITDGQCTLQ